MKTITLAIAILVSSALTAQAQYYYDNSYNDYSYQQDNDYSQQLADQAQQYNQWQSSQMSSNAISGCLSRPGSGPCTNY